MGHITALVETQQRRRLAFAADFDSLRLATPRTSQAIASPKQDGIPVCVRSPLQLALEPIIGRIVCARLGYRFGGSRNTRRSPRGR